MESFTGSDAALWHLEWPGHPMHTIKALILDSDRRGRPVTLEEIIDAVGPRLGLIKRATQKVAFAKGFRGIPFWVSDDEFDLRRHLDERRLPLPGKGRQLDALYSELAMTPLPDDRPLWAATLVHGLEGGRQAVVIRVHHSLTDGLGALNSFFAATTATPGEAVATSPAEFHPVSNGALRKMAARRFGRMVAALPGLARAGLAGRRKVRRFRATRPELPAFIGNPRNFCNAPSGKARVCATGALPLADLKAVSRATGVTINGVFHAVIAGAMRSEATDRGESLALPTLAAFGIAADAGDSDRLYGNAVSPTNVNMFSNIDDPLERLLATARSCRAGVELRRITGIEMADRWSSYGPRLSARFLKTMGSRVPFTVSHVVTANVRGAPSTRWFGDIEVADWVSISVAVNPCNINFTAHSYCDRLNIGLITTPEAMPDPHHFLDRMAHELDVLLEATAADRGELLSAAS